eukprot:snap_masked-scaffold_21-processed-gene-0.16-mRNA-1 protein AED:1.00 eAED:1.00 QI:0/0/0/0/1/1/4/0/86
MSQFIFLCFWDIIYPGINIIQKWEQKKRDVNIPLLISFKQTEYVYEQQIIFSDIDLIGMKRKNLFQYQYCLHVFARVEERFAKSEY